MPAAAAASLPRVPLSIASLAPNHKRFHHHSLLIANRGGTGTTSRSVACNSSSRSSSSSNSSSCITDFDLYDLMGIDSSCDRSEIKTAYRNLQKKCHPDIAGPAGHDMAIILNEAYALLSDPNSRSAYDKEHAKVAQLRGYSGKPIYSEWFGSESEERAVFVDEVKCIGCLKCALCAEKTFAIESVYGRARVVGQWADPEPKIQEAIQACPVDCISVVERSNLAALEFLMSKQPRGSVRIGMGNTAGARVSNIFVDVKKFQARFQDAKDKAAAAETSSETDLQREARLSAIQAIRSISNWLYWKTPHSSPGKQPVVRLIASKSEEPDIAKLRDAAAARKQTGGNQSSRAKRPASGGIVKEDYWMPSTDALPATASSTPKNSTSSSTRTSSASESSSPSRNSVQYDEKMKQRNQIRWLTPLGPAMVAAVVGRLNLQEDSKAVGGITEHMYGSVALEIVNSPWLQILLVAITWYMIGMVMVGIADAIKSRES